MLLVFFSIYIAFIVEYLVVHHRLLNMATNVVRKVRTEYEIYLFYALAFCPQYWLTRPRYFAAYLFFFFLTFFYCCCYNHVYDSKWIRSWCKYLFTWRTIISSWICYWSHQGIYIHLILLSPILYWKRLFVCVCVPWNEYIIYI